MDGAYGKVSRLLEAAKQALGNGLPKASANYMRQIAEVVTRFYIEKYDFGDKKNSLNDSIYTLWYKRKPSAFNNSIKKPLLVFACQAQLIGNRGSHPDKDVEEWEAEHLVLFFEKYVMPRFKYDCGVRPHAQASVIDVTKQFNNRRILIYSMKAEHYASTREDFDECPVCCSADDPGKWEVYSVEVDANGQASFLSHTGKYVSVDLSAEGANDCPPIRAIGPEGSTWEKFKIYDCDGYYAFKALVNNKWVMCQADREHGPLLAASKSIDWWEMFDIQEV